MHGYHFWSRCLMHISHFKFLTLPFMHIRIYIKLWQNIVFVPTVFVETLPEI